MIPLYTEYEFNNCKSRSQLPLKCEQCGETFYAIKHQIQKVLRGKLNVTVNYCSRKCVSASRTTKQEVICKQCNTIFLKLPNQIKKSPNHFCSRSCAGTYNNTHKTIGTRRSKLEIQLENKLTKLYPDLEIHFNRKDTIQSELDIYIPSLQLAIELNGIFHYEPIYGDNKLQSIQCNDNNKFMKCQQQNISLCIIDTSKQTYFKEQTSVKYLKIITDIIDQHLACI